MEVVGGQLLSFLDCHHRPAGEGEVVPGEADGVGRAGVVEDGGDGEEPLQVHILGGVLPDDVGVGVDHPHHMQDLLLRELHQLAVPSDELQHPLLGLGQLPVVLQVVHQHVDQLPLLRPVVPEPEDPEHHDGVVGGACGLVVLDDEPGVVELEERALPGVRPVLQLTVGAAQRPAAVPAPVHQARQPLEARQAHRLGVVVGPDGGGGVVEDDLAGLDVPRGDEQAAASLLVEDGVGEAGVGGLEGLGVLHLAGGGAVDGGGAGAAGHPGVGGGAHHTLWRAL